MSDALMIRHAPLTIIDIGAMGGAHERWSRFPNAKIVGFEPNQEEFLKLKSSKSCRWLNTGVAQEKGIFDLHITRYPTNISLLKPNLALIKTLDFDAADFEIEKTVPVSCDALDSICDKNAVRPDFIKADTQGTELQILRGAEALLRGSVFAVEVEVEFVPLYESQPLFPDVHSYLINLGFQLMDLGNMVHVKGRHSREFGGPKSNLIAADALYFRSRSPAAQAIGQGSISLEAACAICLAYGYQDYAVELCMAVSSSFPADCDRANRCLEALRAANRSPLRRLGKRLAALRAVRAFRSRIIKGLDRALAPVQRATWFEGPGN